MMKSKVIAFSHIPKNAGSLVTFLLRSNFGMNHCRAFCKGSVYSLEDLKKDLVVYPALKAISGHPLRPYVDFKDYESNLVWAVLLRDPYTRFPSQYKWWCQKNESSISFEEWCKLKGEKFANFQCRWISGVPDHQSALDVISSKNVVIGFQSDIGAFIGKLAGAAGLTSFPWIDSLVINPTEGKRKMYPAELIEMYNSEDILLFQKLLTRETQRSARGQQNSWSRAMRPKDRINYYLNLAKHMGLYKPYKRIC